MKAAAVPPYNPATNFSKNVRLVMFPSRESVQMCEQISEMSNNTFQPFIPG
jgi:hypothetical protein